VEADGLSPKDDVRLSFKLPVSGVIIDAAGVVVWAKENRQRIHFTSVGAESQRSIRRFMDEVENMER